MRSYHRRAHTALYALPHRSILMQVVAAAAYNLTFQVGFATTQLCESIAIAVQTLIARELSQGLARPKSETERTRSNLYVWKKNFRVVVIFLCPYPYHCVLT